MEIQLTKRNEEQEQRYKEEVSSIRKKQENKHYSVKWSSPKNYIFKIKKYNSGFCKDCKNFYTDLDYHMENKHVNI